MRMHAMILKVPAIGIIVIRIKTPILPQSESLSMDPFCKRTASSNCNEQVNMCQIAGRIARKLHA